MSVVGIVFDLPKVKVGKLGSILNGQTKFVFVIANLIFKLKNIVAHLEKLFSMPACWHTGEHYLWSKMFTLRAIYQWNKEPERLRAWLQSRELREIKKFVSELTLTDLQRLPCRACLVDRIVDLRIKHGPFVIDPDLLVKFRDSDVPKLEEKNDNRHSETLDTDTGEHEQAAGTSKGLHTRTGNEQFDLGLNSGECCPEISSGLDDGSDS